MVVSLAHYLRAPRHINEHVRPDLAWVLMLYPDAHHGSVDSHRGDYLAQRSSVGFGELIQYVGVHQYDGLTNRQRSVYSSQGLHGVARNQIHIGI